ncbi:MAG: A/G-specific adenine glycosylase [Candidatus Korobacteraceae bacterium]
MGGVELPLTAGAVARFRKSLLRWYDQQRRDLPWRRDRDPYRVWVSEIMLQQTRVAAVLDHYARFLKRFPTVQSLAAARETSVLALWSGLGYYHRARRMHQAAKIIVRERAGIFPHTAEDWVLLPGIGRYTAAAIASIAFEEAVAAVDGNVERVIARLFGQSKGKGITWSRAAGLLDNARPGDFNQAMMELGATICTPVTPQCLLCPVHGFCTSRGAEASRPQAARRRKQLYYALTRRNDSVLLVQRPADASLMAGMWELPSLAPGSGNGSAPLARLRHSITDTDYAVSVFLISPDQLQELATGAQWFTQKQSERLPLTGLTRKVLRRLLLESSKRAAESNSQQVVSRRIEFMVTLPAGVRAPDFTLPTVEGRQVSLAQMLTKGPLVLAFFKVSCPVCQYAFPFYERMYRANRNAKVSFIGISQNNARETQAFMKEYGVTFPVALDDPANYAVSNAYGLTNVPTLLYIDPSGEIEVSSVSWSKADVEAVNQKLAALRQQPPAALWRRGEDVRDFRAG